MYSWKIYIKYIYIFLPFKKVFFSLICVGILFIGLNLSELRFNISVNIFLNSQLTAHLYIYFFFQCTLPSPLFAFCFSSSLFVRRCPVWVSVFPCLLPGISLCCSCIFIFNYKWHKCLTLQFSTVCVGVCWCVLVCVCGCHDNNEYRNLLLGTHKPTKSTTNSPKNLTRFYFYF